MAAQFKLPTIYPITDRQLSGISHAEQVTRLIRGGAELIQLRDKTATSAEFYSSVVESVRMARESGVRLIVNDRVDIARIARADGVHLGQDDLPADKAREILGKDAIIGLSTHSVEQAREAARMPVDYIAIGPVFQTHTKEKPDPVIGLATIREVRKLIGPKPLVAIGGINRSTLRQVLASGADSAAVVSEIIKGADDIEEQMRILASICSGSV